MPTSPPPPRTFLKIQIFQKNFIDKSARFQTVAMASHVQVDPSSRDTLWIPVLTPSCQKDRLLASLFFAHET